MGHTDGAHIHGSGGTIALIAGGAILAAAIADPVAHAAAELVRIVVIAVAVVIGLAIAAGAALAAVRLRHRAASASADASPAQLASRQPAERLPAAHPPAIEDAREVHLHFHGVTAEDVAAVLARRDE